MSLDAVAEEFALNTAAELGSAVVITLAGGGSVEFRAHYRSRSELVDIGEIIEMDGVAGAVEAPRDAVASVQRGDACDVGGVSYIERGIEKHQMAGRTVLVLGI